MPPGRKLHRRKTDKRARSLSPQKLDFTPVGKMFFEGAPRILRSGVTIPHLREGDPRRLVVEAYPGVLARAVTTEQYKNDNRKKQTSAQREARGRILEALTSGALSCRYGLTVVANKSEFVDDPTGDRLDALLCAVQAAWAWLNLTTLLDEVTDIDLHQGWIADPGGV